MTERVAQIYLLSEGPGGPVKVGRSNGVQARLCALQTGNPRKLNLVAVWNTSHDDACEAERLLKDEWSYSSLKGEWYETDERFAVEYLRDFFAAHGLELLKAA